MCVRVHLWKLAYFLPLIFFICTCITFVQIGLYIVYFLTSISSLFGYFLILQTSVVFHFNFSCCFVCVCSPQVFLSFCLLYFWIMYYLIVQKILQVCFFPFSPFIRESLLFVFVCVFVYSSLSLLCRMTTVALWSSFTFARGRTTGPQPTPPRFWPSGAKCRASTQRARRLYYVTAGLYCVLLHQAGLYSVASGWSVLCLVKLVCILLCQGGLYSFTSG